MRTLDLNQMELIEGGIKWKCILSLLVTAGGVALSATGVASIAGGAIAAAGATGVIASC
jgi:hypothetical protein